MRAKFAADDPVVDVVHGGVDDQVGVGRLGAQQAQAMTQRVQGSSQGIRWGLFQCLLKDVFEGLFRVYSRVNSRAYFRVQTTRNKLRPGQGVPQAYTGGRRQIRFAETHLKVLHVLSGVGHERRASLRHATEPLRHVRPAKWEQKRSTKQPGQRGAEDSSISSSSNNINNSNSGGTGRT